jgi:hypothetical protein
MVGLLMMAWRRKPVNAPPASLSEAEQRKLSTLVEP